MGNDPSSLCKTRTRTVFLNFSRFLDSVRWPKGGSYLHSTFFTLAIQSKISRYALWLVSRAQFNYMLQTWIRALDVSVMAPVKTSQPNLRKCLATSHSPTAIAFYHFHVIRPNLTSVSRKREQPLSSLSEQNQGPAYLITTEMTLNCGPRQYTPTIQIHLTACCGRLHGLTQVAINTDDID